MAVVAAVDNVAQAANLPIMHTAKTWGVRYHRYFSRPAKLSYTYKKRWIIFKYELEYMFMKIAPSKFNEAK